MEKALGRGEAGQPAWWAKRNYHQILSRNCHMWSNIVKGCRAAWPNHYVGARRDIPPINPSNFVQFQLTCLPGEAGTGEAGAGE